MTNENNGIIEQEDNKKEKKEKKNVWDKVLDYIDDNPQQAMTLIAAATTIVGTLIKVAFGGSSPWDGRVKDDITELEYVVKHPLSNREILELSDRMKNGETKGRALQSMGLLKKEKKRR